MVRPLLVNSLAKTKPSLARCTLAEQKLLLLLLLLPTQLYPLVLDITCTDSIDKHRQQMCRCTSTATPTTLLVVLPSWYIMSLCNCVFAQLHPAVLRQTTPSLPQCDPVVHFAVLCKLVCLPSVPVPVSLYAGHV